MGLTATVRTCFFFQAEGGIRDKLVTGVQTCALPISCRTTDESFPDPRIVLSESERVFAWPPLVEISDDRDMFCIWGPHRKMGSILSIKSGWMGAEFFAEFEVFSFFEEVDVVGGQ